MALTAEPSTGVLTTKWTHLDPAEATIEFDGVVKEYPDGTTAVNKISLVCPARKITAFVGPSGCGKTTSLRMINRMIEPTAGRISIGDVDTTRLDPTVLRRQMGYVIQNAGLFPHRRVIDNVATVPRLLGATRRDAHRRAEELLEMVGLDPALGRRFPYQLSGGQQQRVGVARALASDPPVLLMDEPFSAVDPIVRVDLQLELLRLQRDIGKTIVFVTHDIDEAVRLADQIIVFQRNGTIAQAATPAEVLTAPASEFVRQLVGRDAGLRWMSLLGAESITPTPTPVVAEGGDVAARSDWVLRTSAAGAPTRWTRGTDAAQERPATVRRWDTVNLRDLLDAVITSPTGNVVLTDEHGRPVGTIDEADVVAAAEAQRPRVA